MGRAKPCPFCGSGDISIEKDDAVYWEVYCKNCGANVGAYDCYETIEEALETWNRRAQESEKDEH